MAEEISTSQFIALLKKSDVLGGKIIEELLAKFLTEGAEPPPAKRLAKSLIDEKALTPWQAKFLLSGRHRLKIGSHVLLKRLGRDQFGDRFLAVHQSLKRKVVLEIFSKEVSGDSLKRKALLEKASMVAKLDHPNLVHVYDIDEEGDRLYIVVEHVDGKVIDVTQTMNCDEPEIAGIIKACVSGLFYAHQHDVVHGSILPEDLVLEPAGSIKIQNLSLSPLRSSHQDDRTPSESDDFIALSNVALKLLSANKSVTPHENRDQLKQIFAKFRKNPEVVAGELDRWIEANPPRNVATAPQVVALPDARTSGGHQLNKSGANSVVNKFDQEGDQEIDRGYFARLWQDNPVKLIATLVVPFLLLNVVGLALVYQWTRPVAKVGLNENDSGSQSAALEAERRLKETTGEKTLTAADVDDPEKIRELINGRLSTSNTDENKGGNPKTPTPDGNAKKANQANTGNNQKKADPKGNGAAKSGGNSGGNNKPGNGGNNKPGNGGNNKPGNAGINPAQANAGNAGENKTPPAAPFIPKAEKETADDLKKIVGIGEATQKNLAGVGIKTFGQLAKMKPSDLNQIGKKFNRFGIPIADATRIIEQAKKFSTQTVSTTKPGAGNKPAADPSSPYANFPRQKNLPPIEKTDSVVLAPLVIRQQYMLGLDIIAPEGIGRAKMIYELERKDEGRIQNWIVGVKRSERQKPEPIAMFTKTEKEFKFKWLEKAGRTRGAGALRNCFVKLHTPDDQATVLSLRRPISVPPLRLDPETLKAEVKFDIDELPDPSRIRIEFQKVDRGEAYIDIGLPIAKLGENARIFFRDIKRNNVQADTLWVEMGGEFRPKMTVAAAVNIDLGNQVPIVIKDYEAFTSLHNQLKQARLIATNNARLKPGDRSLSDKRSKAEADLSKMNAYVRGVDRLREVPINFRVIAEFDGYQAVLAVSNPKLTEESYKKKKRASEKPAASGDQAGAKPGAQGKDDKAPAAGK